MMVDLELYIELLQDKVKDQREEIRKLRAPRKGAVASMLGISDEDVRATEADFVPRKNIVSDVGFDANGSPVE